MKMMGIAGKQWLHFRTWLRRSMPLYIQYSQFRINNSSKCSNCFGPCAFGVPAVFRVIFVLYNMQGWILQFRCTRQGLIFLSLYFTHAIPKLFRWKQVKFFILSWKSVSHCKSFELIWFLNCSLSKHYRCLETPFPTFAHDFCFILIKMWFASEPIKGGSGRVINKHFNKTLQN